MHFANIDSTNSQLINGITSNVLNHQKIHLFTADHQSAGRGQYGRTWVSNKGNVFLSLYIPIGKSQYHLHQLSGMLSPVMGLALSQLPMIKAINQIRKNHQLSPIGVKWANDVGFYDDKVGIFKKLAGILIEPIFKKLNGKSVLVGVVVGVGLNVNSTPVIKNGLYQAVSLKDLDSHLMV